MDISSTRATILLGSLIALSLSLSNGGSVPGLAAQAPQVKPKPVKVTGCLQKGDEESEFVITDKAGKRHEIESKSVALAGHVGHTVTVKGSMLAEEKGEKEAKEEKGEEKAKEYEGGHVQVASLAMVSPKCK